MYIMVAGPYSAPTEKERRENLERINRAAAEVAKKGHIPVVGVNAALPVVLAGDFEDDYAELMRISLLTVERHRHNIRKKLHIDNEKVNLSTFLRTL